MKMNLSTNNGTPGAPSPNPIHRQQVYWGPGSNVVTELRWGGSCFRRGSRTIAGYNSPSSRMIRLLLVTSLGLSALAILGCHKEEQAVKPVVEVQATTVSKGEVTENIEADAILAPVAQAAIAPKITAPVRKFLVQRGASVHAGQLLAVLENRDLEA